MDKMIFSRNHFETDQFSFSQSSQENTIYREEIHSGTVYKATKKM